MQKLNYQAPQTELLTVATEHGFAASATIPDYKPNPGGDESEDF